MTRFLLAIGLLLAATVALACGDSSRDYPNHSALIRALVECDDGWCDSAVDQTTAGGVLDWDNRNAHLAVIVCPAVAPCISLHNDLRFDQVIKWPGRGVTAAVDSHDIVTLEPVWLHVPFWSPESQQVSGHLDTGEAFLLIFEASQSGVP